MNATPTASELERLERELIQAHAAFDRKYERVSGAYKFWASLSWCVTAVLLVFWTGYFGGTGSVLNPYLFALTGFALALWLFHRLVVERALYHSKEYHQLRRAEETLRHVRRASHELWRAEEVNRHVDEMLSYLHKS